MSNTKSIKAQATNSVLWSAIERFSVQGIQYAINIVIARILIPEDYGMIAMLNIFLAISQTFVDGGFGNALIQKKDRTEMDYSTVFYFNIIISIVLYILLYISSPFIASFFNEEKLNSITKVVGLVLIINSLGIVQQTKLIVALNFKQQAVASLIAVIISGTIGITMAYNGYGVWTLVWYTLLNNALRVTILWILAKWTPMFYFSTKSFKTLFSFGSKILLSSLLHTIYTNLYTLVIGKKFAAGDVGYYSNASNLAQFPSSNFTNIIVRAVYPIQCRIQDDPEQLNPLFLTYLRMACYVIFPIMIALCIVAEPLIEVILKDKWLPAVPYFQILCIAYMWDPVMKINHNMLNVKGRSDFFLRAEIIKKIIAVVILICTIPFGIKTMCFGLIVYAFADMLVITHYTKKITDITLMIQVRSLIPVILLSVSMGGAIYLAMMTTSDITLKLVIGITTAGTYYALMSYIFKFKEFAHLISIVKNR